MDTNTTPTTYAEVIAAPFTGHLDRVRAIRAVDPTMFYVRSAMRRHGDDGRRYQRNCAAAVRRAYWYSDEGLTERLTCGAPGLEREARILLDVPPEHRAEVVRRAHTFINATPDAGRWSDAVRSCSHDFPSRSAS